MVLACDDVGAGPVVVLLHGFPFDRTTWAAQVDALKARHRVLTPDLPGHGASPARSAATTVSSMAQDVIDTLENHGVAGPVVVGGLSMGGYVALALAVEHPRRVRGLMLINSRAAADPPATKSVREDLARLVLADGHPGAVVDAMLPKLFAPGVGATDLAVTSIERVMRGTSPAGVAATLRGLALRPDRTPDLPSIAVPTLIVAGAEDQLIPIDESRAIQAAIPSAQLVVIAEAGHLAPLERPDAVNQAVLAFLDSLGTGG